MKKVLFVFFIISGFNVHSQKTNDLITFSENIDGIDISISTPNKYEIIKDPNDKNSINTVFLISKKVTSNLFRNVIKVSQQSIPNSFTDEMVSEFIKDEKNFLQMYEGMKRSKPLMEIDKKSLNSITINGVNFFGINFKEGIENHISYSTFYKRKMWMIYFTYNTLKEEEIEEFQNIIKTLIIK